MPDMTLHRTPTASEELQRIAEQKQLETENTLLKAALAQSSERCEESLKGSLDVLRTAEQQWQDRQQQSNEQQKKQLEELNKNVDSLVIIPNERLKYVSEQKITFKNAFEIADGVLRQAVKNISELITVPGFINLDFADVTSVMKDAGYAHIGTGRAAGKDKAAEAARMAISSPLLETSIDMAHGVIVSVIGSDDIGLDEVETAATMVQQAAHPDAHIIFGAFIDDTMDDEIRVVVIATGFDNIPNSAKMDMDGSGLQRKAAPAQTGSGLFSNASAEAEQKPAAKPQSSSDVGSDDAAFDVLMRIFDKDHR